MRPRISAAPASVKRRSRRLRTLRGRKWPCGAVPGHGEVAARRCGLVALPLIGWGALEIAIRQLPKLDMARASERSTVVVDREGRLLRPFVMADGRWRMPVSLDEVDPRYIEMLVAYEDRRFYGHAGVDPLALARAAGRWHEAVASSPAVRH